MATQPVRILSAPGIKRDGTMLEGEGYVDGRWVRFDRGLPLPEERVELLFELAEAEAQGTRLQAAMDAHSLAEMRAMSSDKVAAIAQRAGIRAMPDIDGYYLPGSVDAIFAAGRQSDVPVVTGSTANDLGTGVPIRAARTLADYRALAAKSYGGDTGTFLDLWPATTDAAAAAQADLSALTRPRKHRVLAMPEFDFEALKIGGGPAPYRVPEGWLLLHHGVVFQAHVGQHILHRRVELQFADLLQLIQPLAVGHHVAAVVKQVGAG